MATLESATADKCTKLDVKQLVLWLKARGSSSSLLAHTSGLARVALETLTDNGIAVEASVAADLERRLTLSEAGEEQKQCENAMVAYLIITNHPPTEDQVSDWERRVASQKGKEIRNVNLVGEDAYKKRMKLTTSTVQRPNLEQALDRGRRVFRQWFTEMAAALSSHGMPKASQRLAELCNDAEEVSDGNWVAEEAYLRHYFFREHLGMGVPTRQAPGSFRKAISVLNRPMTAAETKTQQLQMQMEQVSQMKLRARSEAGSDSPGGVGGLQALIDLASVSGSSVGSGSTSSSSIDTSASTALVKAAVREVLAAQRAGGTPGGAQVDLEGRAAATVPAGAVCSFCNRPAGRSIGSQCGFPLDPSSPCRAARQALEALRVQRKTAREAEEGKAARAAKLVDKE